MNCPTAFRALLAAILTVMVCYRVEASDVAPLGSPSVEPADTDPQPSTRGQRILASLARLAELTRREPIPLESLSLIESLRQQVLAFQQSPDTAPKSETRIKPEAVAPTPRSPPEPDTLKADPDSLRARQDRLSGTHLAPSIPEMTRRAQRDATTPDVERTSITAQVLTELERLAALIRSASRSRPEIDVTLQRLNDLAQKL